MSYKSSSNSSTDSIGLKKDKAERALCPHTLKNTSNQVHLSLTTAAVLSISPAIARGACNGERNAQIEQQLFVCLVYNNNKKGKNMIRLHKPIYFV